MIRSNSASLLIALPPIHARNTSWFVNASTLNGPSSQHLQAEHTCDSRDLIVIDGSKFYRIPLAPAHLGKLSRADTGDYSPQFAIRLVNKDFGLVLETAAAARVPMPATAAAFQMNMAEFSEDREEDFSAVITLMERLAGLAT